MPYVKYNGSQEVIAMSEIPQPDFEYVENLPQSYLDAEAQRASNIEHHEVLNATDWKVIRHRDQLADGITTSLTAQEYQDLLDERQVHRDAIVE